MIGIGKKTKVSFTAAAFNSAGPPEGGVILAHAVNKFPIMEIWIDISKGEVIKIYPAPNVPFYSNRQVLLF